MPSPPFFTSRYLLVACPHFQGRKSKGCRAPASTIHLKSSQTQKEASRHKQLQALEKQYLRIRGKLERESQPYQRYCKASQGKLDEG